ncbi:hypothetical protein SAICODRAFT_196884 [Saitoella complicata NRRL Y-17804]|uniref:MalT-like TPR region domain-containing protein n=1 Tax=Saitoella complicata (strain BCRC 22490 / CBS 7301 / JCM 7358 / NBRC 10748 / NRRL Y-17804) TaxID=698492 RepID=A0A0E9NKB8_SAICN|nr:uncharacterized protein SAICODRAFT_196884 [Saitoella complicata NRRL Y-17804]ODQ54943.1 hypothetical protein SAICODRAFT_196884 [Saitoella complicata NRRL Y-17804]GAO49845.1 hypothetical protein G7K_3982-t1 [Saitoella complicata NRRL Y-17804]
MLGMSTRSIVRRALATRPIQGVAARPCIRSSIPLLQSPQSRTNASSTTDPKPDPAAEPESPKPKPKSKKPKPNFLVTTVALFCILSGLTATGYALYDHYFNFPYPFPAPIAEQLRKAIYWHKHGDDIPKALEHYRKALRMIDELAEGEEGEGAGMDKGSDAVTGVKIQIAGVYEEIERPERALQIYTTVLYELQKAIAELPSKPLGEKETPADREADRLRMQKRAVSVALKTGQIRADMSDDDEAEKILTWAVQTMLTETNKNPTPGIWMTTEEMGGTLESLAHFYLERGKAALATPLFVAAYNMSEKEPTCHSVVLMNSISGSISELPAKSPKSIALRSRDARAWSTNAIDLAQRLDPNSLDPECAEGCAVAAFNLGMIAEMEGGLEGARKWFRESLRRSREVGFKEGVVQGMHALERVVEGKKAKLDTVA